MKFAAAVVLLLALASVASARPVGLRSLLSDDKEPTYCSHKDDKCPEHYECAALDKEVCKHVKACKKDKYGKDHCTSKKQCWEYECKEVPKYCEVSYDKEDECATKYGKHLECKQLKKEECVDEKECKYVDTDVCKDYDNEEECVEVDTKICLKYNQEQKCAKDRKVCKKFKEEKKCKPGKCTKHDKYGKCSDYGKEHCEYVPTKDCKDYETVKGKCVYVNTTCKEFKKVEKCKEVKECEEYEQKEVCKDVKKCWNAKCVEVPKKGGYTFGK